MACQKTGARFALALSLSHAKMTTQASFKMTTQASFKALQCLFKVLQAISPHQPMLHQKQA